MVHEWHVALASGLEDWEGILALQQATRAPTADGFTTVQHTLPLLERFHDLAPSVVARDAAGHVVGYALAMVRGLADSVPVLGPMFEQLDVVPELHGARWYVMGQVAVAKAYRGTGVFDALYAEHRRQYADRFDWLVTEISERNPRSLAAHRRVGFRTLHRYEHSGDTWQVVGWNLRQAKGEERGA